MSEYLWVFRPEPLSCVYFHTRNHVKLVVLALREGWSEQTFADASSRGVHASGGPEKHLREAGLTC